MKRPHARGIAPVLLLVLLGLAVFAANIHRAASPGVFLFGADEQHHLPRIMSVHQSLSRDSHADPFREEVDYWPDWWPPLTYLAGAFSFRVFGPGRDKAIIPIALAHLILGIAAFLVVAPAGGGWMGLWTAGLCWGAPPLAQYAGVVGLDLVLAATVACSLALLSACEAFRKTPASLLFGLSCGLGLLAKPTFLLFVGPALIALLLMRFRRMDRPAGARLAAALALAVLVASYWYADRGWIIIRSLYFHLVDYQGKPGVSWFRTESGAFFPWELIRGAGLPTLGLIVLGLIGAGKKRRAERIALAVAVVVPLGVIALAPSDPERFWLPAMAPGLMLAGLALSDRPPKFSKTLFIVAMVLIVAQGALSRVYGRPPTVPGLFPEKVSVPVFENAGEVVDALLAEPVSTKGGLCVFSERGRLFHEGYLRYLAQVRQPEISAFLYGPGHFHYRQFERFLEGMKRCETVLFRTPRPGVERPDEKSVRLAVNAGDIHSLRPAKGLAKGLFPEGYDIQGRLDEVFAPFVPVRRLRMRTNSEETPDRLIILRRKET